MTGVSARTHCVDIIDAPERRAQPLLRVAPLRRPPGKASGSASPHPSCERHGSPVHSLKSVSLTLWLSPEWILHFLNCNISTSFHERPKTSKPYGTVLALRIQAYLRDGLVGLVPGPRGKARVALK